MPVELFQPTSLFFFFLKQQRKLKAWKWIQHSKGIWNFTTYNNFLYRVIHLNS
jgi:hypothetical protein